MILSGCQVFQIPIFIDSNWSGFFSFADENLSIYSPNSGEIFCFPHFPGLRQKFLSSLCQVLVSANPCFHLLLHGFSDLWNFRRFQVEPSLVEFSFLPVRSKSHDDEFCGRSLPTQSMYYVNILRGYINWNLLTYFDDNVCQVLTFAFRYTMHLDIKFLRTLL